MSVDASAPLSLGVLKARRAKQAAKLWIVLPRHRLRACRCAKGAPPKARIVHIFRCNITSNVQIGCHWQACRRRQRLIRFQKTFFIVCAGIRRMSSSIKRFNSSLLAILVIDHKEKTKKMALRASPEVDHRTPFAATYSLTAKIEGAWNHFETLYFGYHHHDWFFPIIFEIWNLKHQILNFLLLGT